MKITTIETTFAAACLDLVPASFASVPSHMSVWAAPVQGIAMSAPAAELGYVDHVGGATTTVAANAAKGANRKRTTGYEAFEDPV